MNQTTARVGVMAPHHLPAGEMGLAVIETVEAMQIALRWGNDCQPALVTFAERGHLGPLGLAEAVREVRVNLSEHCAIPAEVYGLRLLLAHLQGLCQARDLHQDDEPYWCWCQPYDATAPTAPAA